jgi:hypothetical protein
MIKEITPLFYANRLKETKKVFLAQDGDSYFELGLGNSFYKAIYSFILCKHFGVEVPEIKRVSKYGMQVYCQQVYSDWKEFDMSSNFLFNSNKSINLIQNREKIIRQALFDEQFMVFRNEANGYNLALTLNEKYKIVSRDYYEVLSSNYQKGNQIQYSIFFRNILASLSLDQIIQEIENYFSLQDSIIEEKVLLLSAYLKESKYKELFLGFLTNGKRNEEIRNNMLKNVYLLKR